MNIQNQTEVSLAKKAALEVLLHNMHGPFQGLPRTAGWGYPEPYTRDLMISILGIAVSGNKELLKSIRKTLETLAKNQTPRGIFRRWCTTRTTEDRATPRLCFW